MSDTVLFDILTTLIPKFSEGVPSVTYMRQKVEGSMLFETTLIDMGILNGSALLRVTFTPGKFEISPSSTSSSITSPNMEDNSSKQIQPPPQSYSSSSELPLDDNTMDEEEDNRMEEEDDDDNSGRRKAPKMILKESFTSSSSSSPSINTLNTSNSANRGNTGNTTPNYLLNPEPPSDPYEKCVFYLGEIRRTISDPEYTASMKTIGKIIDNIVNKPGEPMVRRMKTTNAAFSKKILAYPNCINLLFSLGFTIYSDESGDYYMLKPEDENEKLLKDIQERVRTIVEAQMILNQNMYDNEEQQQRINFDPYKPIVYIYSFLFIFLSFLFFFCHFLSFLFLLLLLLLYYIVNIINRSDSKW